MGKVKDTFITDEVDTDKDTFEPDLSDIDEQPIEWVGYWVEIGTNYRLSAVKDTRRELELEMTNAKRHTGQIYTRPKTSAPKGD